MGNCILKGRRLGAAEEKAAVVKVVTPNGGVMELQSPITAETITNEFPGHAIFPSPAGQGISPPLRRHEQLHPRRQSNYYLLPLQQAHNNHSPNNTVEVADMMMMPYRISVDHHNHHHHHQQQQTSSDAYFRGRYNSSCSNITRGRGVWKVRLAINSDQLSEILSQEARTEALIESVRTVAKCSSGVQSPVKSDHRRWAT